MHLMMGDQPGSEMSLAVNVRILASGLLLSWGSLSFAFETFFCKFFLKTFPYVRATIFVVVQFPAALGWGDRYREVVI